MYDFYGSNENLEKINDSTFEEQFNTWCIKVFCFLGSYVNKSLW